MKSLLSSLFILIAVVATAQVPEPHMLSLQVYGGSGGDGIISYTTRTPDGGLIIALSTNSSTGPVTDSFCPPPPSNRVVFMKYDAVGSTREWFKCRKSSWPDTGYILMFETTDSKYVLSGTVNSGSKWVIRKEDAAGNALWIKAYGGSGSQMLRSMIQTNDGGFVLFGSAYGGDGDIGFHYGSPFTRDFWVLKIDANGEKVWSKVYGGTGEDLAASIVRAPDDGFYLVGATGSSDYDCTSNNGDADLFLTRLDDTGGIVWNKCLGGTDADGGGDIEGCRGVEDGSGGLLVATRTSSADGDISHRLTPTGTNAWILHIDQDGNIIWDKCYGGSGAEYPNAICWATNGDIWTMGASKNTGEHIGTAYGGNSDAWLLHLDGHGNFLNSKVLGSSGQDMGYMVQALADGKVMAGGYYENGNGSFPPTVGTFPDAFLAVFSPETNSVSNSSASIPPKLYPNPASSFVNIESSTSYEPGIVTVTSTTGNTIFSSAMTEAMRIDVRDWSPGVYFLQMKNENGFKETQKLIVQ